MQSVAIKKHLRISRRKVARVGKDCIGKKIKEVKAQLSFLPNESAREIFQTIKSAESNFINKNPNFNPDDLVIKNILVDKGPSFKRIIYRAKGRANRIEKKTSHLKVVLEQRVKKTPVAPAKALTKAPRVSKKAVDAQGKANEGPNKGLDKSKADGKVAQKDSNDK